MAFDASTISSQVTAWIRGSCCLSCFARESQRSLTYSRKPALAAVSCAALTANSLVTACEAARRGHHSGGTSAYPQVRVTALSASGLSVLWIQCFSESHQHTIESVPIGCATSEVLQRLLGCLSFLVCASPRHLPIYVQVTI